MQGPSGVCETHLKDQKDVLLVNAPESFTAQLGELGTFEARIVIDH